MRAQLVWQTTFKSGVCWGQSAAKHERRKFTDTYRHQDRHKEFIKMRGVLLFTIFAVAIVSRTNANKFPGVITILDQMLTGGYASCTGRCLVDNLQQLTQTAAQQCQPVFDRIGNESIKFYTGGDSFTDFYNGAIKRQSGNRDSRMCTWADVMRSDCFEPVLGKFCNEGMINTLREFAGQIRPYMCERSPAFLECVLSPEVINATDFTGCVSPFTERFAKYFNTGFTDPNSFFTLMQTFYDEQIKPNNGEKIYGALRDLGTCVSNKIGAVFINPEGTAISCSPVKTLIDSEVKGIIDYFKKTDILQCAVNPTLWKSVVDCGQPVVQRMLQDAQFNTGVTPYPGAQPDSSFEIGQALVRGEYSRFKSYYTELKDTCLLGKIQSTCGKEWTYNVLKTQLASYDSLIEQTPYEVSGMCEKFSTASTSTVAASVLTFALATVAALNF